MTAPLASTLTPDVAADRAWDVIVIGAGPAGALAARQVAIGGAAVLLVDKATFPRTKVCGSCLNGAALATLGQLGLAELPARLGAVSLSRWRLHTRAAQAECRLPTGVALSREAFDAALVAEAILAGAKFLGETRAVVAAELVDREPLSPFAPRKVASSPFAEQRNVLSRSERRQTQTLPQCRRQVALIHGAEEVVAFAKLVLVADGLAGNSLADLPHFEPQVSENSRLGAGAILNGSSDDFAPGCIYMASGRGGYVGLVRLEDNRLDVAAAFDRDAMRDAGGPGPFAARILGEVKLAVPNGLEGTTWRGTPPLSRRRATAGERIFALGDAAGYLEPFTGEGMAWALASAAAVAPLVLDASANWRPELAAKWTQLQLRVVGRRQRVCRLAGAILRRPMLAGIVSRTLAIAPWLASPLIGGINRN